MSFLLNKVFNERPGDYAMPMAVSSSLYFHCSSFMRVLHRRYSRLETLEKCPDISTNYVLSTGLLIAQARKHDYYVDRWCSRSGFRLRPSSASGPPYISLVLSILFYPPRSLYRVRGPEDSHRLLDDATATHTLSPPCYAASRVVSHQCAIFPQSAPDKKKLWLDRPLNCGACMAPP